MTVSSVAFMRNAVCQNVQSLWRATGDVAVSALVPSLRRVDRAVAPSGTNLCLARACYSQPSPTQWRPARGDAEAVAEVLKLYCIRTLQK